MAVLSSSVSSMLMRDDASAFSLDSSFFSLSCGRRVAGGAACREAIAKRAVLEHLSYTLWRNHEVNTHVCSSAPISQGRLQQVL